MAYHPMSEAEVRAFLTALPARTGKLATVCGDGRRHVAPIWFDLDDDGAVVIPQKLLEEVAATAADQEQMEEWIMSEVNKGASLPGLYPPNAENKARYEAWAKRGR